MAFSDLSTSEKWGIGLLSTAGVLLVGGAVIFAKGRRSRVGLGAPQLLDHRVSPEGMQLKHYYDGKMPIKDRVRLIQNLIEDSVKDPAMRELSLKITNSCPDRDGECETKMIYEWIRNNVRYTGDVAPIKMKNGQVEGIDLFQSARRTVQFKGGDCLPAGTLLLTDGHKFVPIEQITPGSKIWGLDDFTQVKDVWFKGILPVDAVYLNNGSNFKATGDHKVYVALCKHHPVRWDNGGTCSCGMSEREIKRIKVSELEPGMAVITPERIAFGTDTIDPDRALIEGLYLSDGWCSHDSDFDIAGRDGHLKEDQKHVVQAICEKLGVATTWFDKSIRIRDKEWALRVQQMGQHAPNKHALSINLDEGAAASLLRGIMADSGANTHGNGRTFTTTSRELALQVRLLHKMFGLTCSERYIVDHGGLGTNPIWRLGVRDRDRSDGKSEKLLRVKAIERTVMHLPVYDISTEDHYVYLPEADITVSNCDDQSILGATLLSLSGIPARLRITKPEGAGPDDWAHIYVMAGLPKTNPKKWVSVDTTLPPYMAKFGKEVPFGKNLDFVA